MGSRLVLAMVAAVAIVAVGGIGFATFSSTATVSVVGSTGTVTLAFGDFTGGTGTSGYSSCEWSAYSAGPPATVTLTVSNLVQGDECEATLGVVDTGTLPVNTLDSSIVGTGGYYCGVSGQTPATTINVADGLGANLCSATTGADTSSPLIDALGASTFTYDVYVAAGSSIAPGISATFTITLVGYSP
jgi:hypothetical protein